MEKRTVLNIFTVAMAALLWAGGVTASAQDAVVLAAPGTGEYPRITLPIRARVDGTPKYPLDPARIVLRENGRLLAFGLDCAPLEKLRPSLALGFERSLDGNFPVLQQAARDFVRRMGFTDDAAEASFWSFATFIDRDLAMTGDSALLARAVDDLTVAQWPFNGTALYETMHRAIEDVSQFGGGDTRAVVFFTDGFNNTNTFGRTWEQVRGRAAADNIRIYVILVHNRDAGRDAMQTLTRATGGFMVEHDVSGAIDSVYSDLTRPDPAAAWCTLTYVSPFCANGQGRRVEAGYVRTPGDTIWTAASYTAPWIADDLRPLHAWISPARPWVGRDTMTVALVVDVRGGAQPPAFTLALPLEGCTLIGSTPLRWGASVTASGTEVLCSAVPPAAGLTDGRYTLARLRLGGCAMRSVPFVLQLRADASGCLTLAQEEYARHAHVVLDTVAAERGSAVRMPLRVHPADMPEGLQRVSVRIATDPVRLPFDAAAPVDVSVMPPGWGISGLRILPAGSKELLELQADGPPLDSAAVLVHLRLDVRDSPVYRIPLRLEPETALNGSVTGERGDGLVVIRDSCFNSLVMQRGMIVSRPWPQPARSTTTLRVHAAEAGMLHVVIRDALGRPVKSFPGVPVSAGTQTVTLHLQGLHSGSYRVSCSDGRETRSLPLVILK